MNDLWARLAICHPPNHAVLVKVEFFNSHPCENSGLPTRLREFDSPKRSIATLGKAGGSAPQLSFEALLWRDLLGRPHKPKIGITVVLVCAPSCRRCDPAPGGAQRFEHFDRGDSISQ